MGEHIALLGDSIFDNAKYTNGEPDVVSHLRRLLPEGWTATLLAVDGSTTSDLAAQVARAPVGVSRAIVSMGGNDGLLNADILDTPVSSTAEALLLFGERVTNFEADYRAALNGIVHRIPRTAVCTVYCPNIDEPERSAVRVGLMLLNDVIIRVAAEHHLPVIDLRFVITEPVDLANPLEPSSQGASKIARAIVEACAGVERTGDAGW